MAAYIVVYILHGTDGTCARVPSGNSAERDALYSALVLVVGV
jgi:hypothetical protein